MIIMVYIYREIDVAASFTTQVIDSHHELLRRYNEGTLFSLLCDHVMVWLHLSCYHNHYFTELYA